MPKLAEFPLVHRVLVGEYYEDDKAEFRMIHDRRCPKENGEYTCHEFFMETEAGLDVFLIHKDDPDLYPSSYQTRVEPGLYEVYAVSERVNHALDPDEWDERLEFVEEPRKPYPGDLPEVAPAEEHQHWAWMNGPGPGHWRIVGTGALLDPETEAEYERRRELVVALSSGDVVFRTEYGDFFALGVNREDDKWVVALEDVNK